MGLGPWNVEKRDIQKRGNKVFADGRPVVFYHYHSLRMLKPVLGLKPIWLSGWFEIPEATVSTIYRAYARELWRVVRDVGRKGHSVIDTLQQLPDRSMTMPYRQVLLSIGSVFVPDKWSGRLFDRLWDYERATNKIDS